jgi:hypothetical protein
MSGLGGDEVEKDVQPLLGRERAVVATVGLVGFLVGAELPRLADHPAIISRPTPEGIRKERADMGRVPAERHWSAAEAAKLQPKQK